MKNESTERTICLDKATRNVLKKQILRIANHPQNENRLVFYTSDSPIQVITNDRLNDVLRSSINKLKINPIITVHGLRHTHASVLLYQDISVLYVSERLGHGSIDITTSTYANLLKELRERDSSKTASIFEDLLSYSW